MNDLFDVRSAAALHSGASTWLVFSIGAERFAVPMGMVEAVAAPPALTAIPHAPPALVGAGNLGGQIVPIVDLSQLLARGRPAAVYRGQGEILRLHTPGGCVGLWVDRVERLVMVDTERSVSSHRAGLGMADELGDLGDITLIDPTPLLSGIAPPVLAAEVLAPVGDVPEAALPDLLARDADSFILVEVDGNPHRLRRDSLAELVETVAWTPLPRAPAGLMRIGVLRGTALPLLSLAALLGLPEPAVYGGYAVIEIEGHRALLAVDRVVGLRFRRRAGSSQQSAEDRARNGFAGDLATAIPVDLETAIPPELRRIILGFVPGDAVADDADDEDGRVEYLTFVLGGQTFGLPIASIDRVVGPQKLIRLPRPANDDADGEALARTAGAIELRGQIMPVAAMRRQLGLAGSDEAAIPAEEPAAYVILRGGEGLSAVGVDQIRQLVTLRPDQIAPPAIEHDLIEGIAEQSGELLRLVAPARLWGRH